MRAFLLRRRRRRHVDVDYLGHVASFRRPLARYTVRSRCAVAGGAVLGALRRAQPGARDISRLRRLSALYSDLGYTALEPS